MEFEVLDATPGDPGRPRRSRALLWVGLGGAALVAGLLVLGHAGPPATADLTGQNGPKPTRAAPTGPPAPTGPGQRQYLAVSLICPPITDGRARLAITFRVTNVSPASLAVVNAVTADLPIGGLRPVLPTTFGGGCRHPGADQMPVIDPRSPGSDVFGFYPVDSELRAGASRFYTLRFRLPRDCPAPYPVRVRVGFVADGYADSLVSALRNDLSTLDFDSCPAAR